MSARTLALLDQLHQEDTVNRPCIGAELITSALILGTVTSYPR
ncbi:hypothetical protein [Lawsonella clevelandensis]|nr:hypothetical protein [Lawsonella clevelandensis]